MGRHDISPGDDPAMEVSPPACAMREPDEACMGYARQPRCALPTGQSGHGARGSFPLTIIPHH